MALNRKSSGHRKGVIIPAENLGFYSETDVDTGGNSTSEVFVSREEIDGVGVDILNIKTNLIRRESKGWVYAKGQTYRQDLIQQMRQANGIRFKARGDGKSWSVQFHTIETTAETDYPSYRCLVGTVRNQTIVVDIPYSSLILKEHKQKNKRFPKVEVFKKALKKTLLPSCQIQNQITAQILGSRDQLRRKLCNSRLT